MRILLIESDTSLSQQIGNALNENAYQYDIAQNLEDGRYYLSIRNYDLILLSWDTQDEKEINLIAEIKKSTPKSSIIVLSSHQTKNEEITALKKGADDFIRKPLDFQILLVRIEAKLRFGASNILEIEELIINPEEEKIIYQGNEIELKGKPFEVLTHLAMHKDQIVSKEQLLDAIWEEPELVTPNVIEVAINQIRQKMDKPLDITTIETVRRRGYRFCFPKKIS
jgi:two-component system OmpR family response regulator